MWQKITKVRTFSYFNFGTSSLGQYFTSKSLTLNHSPTRMLLLCSLLLKCFIREIGNSTAQIKYHYYLFPPLYYTSTEWKCGFTTFAHFGVRSHPLRFQNPEFIFPSRPKNSSKIPFNVSPLLLGHSSQFCPMFSAVLQKTLPK